MTSKPVVLTDRRPIHVFVDAENLSPERLQPFAMPSHLAITVVLGKQTVRSRWEARIGAQARLRFVQTYSGGPNALDFLLSFYVGELVASCPTAPSIVIVSGDKGFDPLLQHLNQRGVPAKRAESLEFLPIVVQIGNMSLAQRVAYAAARLAEFDACPRPPDRCLRILHRLFQHSLTRAELEAVLAGLIESGAARTCGSGATLFPAPVDVQR
jgi:hypothetical protein